MQIQIPHGRNISIVIQSRSFNWITPIEKYEKSKARHTHANF